LFVPDGMAEPLNAWAVYSENYQAYIDTMGSNPLLEPSGSYTSILSILDTMMGPFLIPVEAIT
jgi:hypothetical protein